MTTLLPPIMEFISPWAMFSVIWVILSEMFPNNIRARASSIGSFSHWFFNGLTSFLFPLAAGAFGIGAVFAFYAAATAVSLLFFARFLTETKGRSLEELEKVMLRPRK